MNDAAEPAWKLGPVTDPIDRDVSSRIDVLRIILIGLIVLCHGGLGLLAPGSPPLGTWTRIMLDGLNLRLDSVAVPLFFTISGFLFLRKAPLSRNAYFEVLRHKCLPLAVPYVFFNLVVILYFYFVGSIFLIGSWGFVVKQGVWAKLLGIGPGVQPINTPLWFLRDLLVVFALSPIQLYFFKKAPKLGFWFFLVTWLVVSDNPYSFFGEGFFFYLGGYLARCHVCLAGVSWWQRLGFWTVIAATPVLVWLLPRGITDFRFLALPSKLYMAVGVVFFWRLAAFAVIRDSAVLHRLSRHSFFIYLAHEPVMSLLQARLLTVWHPAGSFQQIACYWITGLGTIALLWGVSKLLSRYCHSCYSVLTGAWRTSTKPRQGRPVPVVN